MLLTSLMTDVAFTSVVSAKASIYCSFVGKLENLAVYLAAAALATP